MKWSFANVGLIIFCLFGIIIVTFFNELTVIDTTKNPKLRAIQFYGNKVKKIDVTKKKIHFSKNDLIEHGEKAI